MVWATCDCKLEDVRKPSKCKFVMQAGYCKIGVGGIEMTMTIARLLFAAQDQVPLSDMLRLGLAFQG